MLSKGFFDTDLYMFLLVLTSIVALLVLFAAGLIVFMCKRRRSRRRKQRASAVPLTSLVESALKPNPDYYCTMKAAKRPLPPIGDQLTKVPSFYHSEQHVHYSHVEPAYEKDGYVRVVPNGAPVKAEADADYEFIAPKMSSFSPRQSVTLENSAAFPSTLHEYENSRNWELLHGFSSFKRSSLAEDSNSEASTDTSLVN
jgi:hypothetical protein